MGDRYLNHSISRYISLDFDFIKDSSGLTIFATAFLILGGELLKHLLNRSGFKRSNRSMPSGFFDLEK